LSILRFLALLIVGCAIQSPSAYAAEFGELLDGPKDGPINLHPKDDVWIGLSDAPKQALPLSNNPIRVAIIDSGVLAEHPQLKGLIAASKDFSGEGIEDRVGHGTVVAIIATNAQAKPEPTEKEAKSSLIIAKVTRMKDGKAVPTRNKVIAAIKWVAERKARIVNLSLGFPDDDDPGNDQLCDTIAHLKDIVFVAAAGNSGPQVRVFPAACDVKNLISVTVQAPWGGPGDIAAPGTVQLQRLE
jgi:subtilisin family serine protease